MALVTAGLGVWRETSPGREHAVLERYRGSDDAMTKGATVGADHKLRRSVRLTRINVESVHRHPRHHLYGVVGFPI
ncbi:MAG: hypothetical protein DMD96_35190 [Candidatus Rokuibacteriota bacterium]|nr:MAG: hypothetical protein DMD96_35190 [Candidatus Rokubacteria bacterium]